ncbi:MAG: hypothetical protein ACRD22_16150 [Terriglobia bacterium]
MLRKIESFHGWVDVEEEGAVVLKAELRARDSTAAPALADSAA